MVSLARIHIVAATLLVVLTRASFAQSSAPQPFAPPEVVAAHMQGLLNVHYSMIAQAAHVSGTVRLLLDVDETGHVVAVRHINLIPMLDQAARDGMLAATFSPFAHDGHPSGVRLGISLHFELGSTLGGGKVRAEVDTTILPILQAMASCEDAMASGAAAVERCRGAVEATDAYDTGALDLRLESRRHLGRALRAAGQTQNAMQVVDAALRLLPPKDGPQPAEREALLAEAARVHLAGDDRSKALDFFKQAVSGMERRLSWPSMTPLERLRLVADVHDVLAEYADALDAVGKPKDANAARQRALQLK